MIIVLGSCDHHMIVKHCAMEWASLFSAICYTDPNICGPVSPLDLPEALVAHSLGGRIAETVDETFVL